MAEKYWSLGAELGTLQAAVRGAADLVEQIVERRDESRAVATLADEVVAVLALVQVRLRDLGVVLYADRAADVASLIDRLHAPHNAVAREVAPDAVVNRGADVVFVPYAARAARRARA